MAVWAFDPTEFCACLSDMTNGGAAYIKSSSGELASCHIPPTFHCLPIDLLLSLQAWLPTFLLHLLCRYNLSTVYSFSVLSESFWVFPSYYSSTCDPFFLACDLLFVCDLICCYDKYGHVFCLPKRRTKLDWKTKRDRI